LHLADFFLKEIPDSHFTSTWPTGEHIWRSIQEQYHQRGKSTTLRDIIDREEYMRHCSAGGVLRDQNNIPELRHWSVASATSNQ